MNLYAYAGNDPVNGKDPSGQSGCRVDSSNRTDCSEVGPMEIVRDFFLGTGPSSYYFDEYTRMADLARNSVIAARGRSRIRNQLRRGDFELRGDGSVIATTQVTFGPMLFSAGYAKRDLFSHTMGSMRMTAEFSADRKSVTYTLTNTMSYSSFMGATAYEMLGNSDKAAALRSQDRTDGGPMSNIDITVTWDEKLSGRDRRLLGRAVAERKKESEPFTGMLGDTIVGNRCTGRLDC